MENQVDAIMRELALRNDQMKAMGATAKGSEEFALLAEARLRSEEHALRVESQQHEAVMGMAKEVASGQASVLRQYELELQKELAEKSNMENQASFVLRNATSKRKRLKELLSKLKLSLQSTRDCCPIRLARYIRW
ncbi:MAG: hypothetical protein ACKPKO_64015, partial [Candidatus Fonsibacter sp.]